MWSSLPFPDEVGVDHDHSIIAGARGVQDDRNGKPGTNTIKLFATDGAIN